MEKVYTATATATGGGREKGHVKSSDGNIDFNIEKPGKTGTSQNGTNPEQLFASAMAPCYLGALKAVAKKENVTLGNTEVTTDVTFNKEGEGFKLSATINIDDDKVDTDTLEKLAEKTKTVCPYTKAVKGNIPVEVNVNKGVQAV